MTTFASSRCERPTDMSKRSTVKTSSDAPDAKPLRRADIAAGKLVLRRRGASGAVLPNKQRVNTDRTDDVREPRQEAAHHVGHAKAGIQRLWREVMPAAKRLKEAVEMHQNGPPFVP
jgi:hypothetical protein